METAQGDSGSGEATSSSLQLPSRLFGRFQVDQRIGSGGVADVYRAFDERENRRVALKCLRRHERARTHTRLLGLFRHEYMVLSQLAHPNVVHVYDFGLHEETHYYTMELLDGKALAETAPLPEAEVEHLLAALCEALSVLHARRWVHLDLSARNVIRTSTGDIKLIDFGATSAMEEHHPLIGTPSYMAPEVLHQQPIDARADVFGLGALAYFTLTGQAPYPARQMAQLPALWARPLADPAKLATISPTMRALVLEMLSIDPDGRPRSTAAVLHRLGHELRGGSPTKRAARAYLDTPKLVGRDTELSQLRALLSGSAAGRGGACAVQGETGSGRSRLLDSLALDARLAGHTTARASGKHGDGSPLALVHSLALALRRSHPEISAPIWPERSAPDGSPFDSEQRIAKTQRAFLDWLAVLCAECPVVLIADDVQSADPESQALFAQLAMRSHRQRLVVAAALGPIDGLPESSLRVFLEHAHVLRLHALDEAQVESWVRSVFGDVHNVARVARWLHRVGGGMPAACAALVEHLVEHGVAYLSAGNWQLPDSLDGLDLPRSVREALYERLQQLSTHARELLELLSVEVEPLPLPVVDYLDAFADQTQDTLISVGELCDAGVLAAGASGYSLVKPGALAWAAEGLDEARRRRWHRALGDHYLKVHAPRDPEMGLFACHHLLASGDQAAADAALPEPSQLPNFTDSARSPASRFRLTDKGISLFEELLALRKARNASNRELHPLRRCLLQLASTTRPELVSYAGETLQALHHDLGIEDWDALDQHVSPADHIRERLRVAQARYDQTPERERGLSPPRALQELAATTAALTGVYAVRYEPQPVWDLYVVIDKLRSLSPGLDLVATMTQVAALTLGFGADARALQRKVIDTIEAGVPGIDEATLKRVHSMYHYYLGLHLAMEGSDEALRLTSILESEPLYGALALQVRRIHALVTGRYREGQRLRRERELLALQSETSNHHLQMSLLRELGAASSCGDALELSRYRREVMRRAERYPGWRPWLALAEANSHMAAEEYHEARARLEVALAELPPFSHGGWEHLVARLAEALVELGEYQQARELARDALSRAEVLEIRLEPERQLRATIARADAGLGRERDACEALDRLRLQTARSLGNRTIPYGQVCEARCKVALVMEDAAAFAEAIEPLEQLYGEHPALRARLERLRRRARDRFDEGEHRAALLGSSKQLARARRLASTIVTGSGEDDVGDYLLAVVLEHTEAMTGHLYRIDAMGRPVLLACRPEQPNARLMLEAQRFCSEWHGGDANRTQTLISGLRTVTEWTADSHFALWILHSREPARPRGLALLEPGRNIPSPMPGELVDAIADQLRLLSQRPPKAL